MILYTIMPNEWVFPVEEGNESPQMNFYYNGVIVTAERDMSNVYKIVKITSTNPNDYLSADLQPGSIINVDSTLLIQ